MTIRAITFCRWLSRFSSRFVSLITLGATVPFIRRKGVVLSTFTNSLSSLVIFCEFESISGRKWSESCVLLSRFPSFITPHLFVESACANHANYTCRKIRASKRTVRPLTLPNQWMLTSAIFDDRLYCIRKDAGHCSSEGGWSAGSSRNGQEQRAHRRFRGGKSAARPL